MTIAADPTARTRSAHGEAADADRFLSETDRRIAAMELERKSLTDSIAEGHGAKRDTQAMRVIRDAYRDPFIKSFPAPFRAGDFYREVRVVGKGDWRQNELLKRYQEHYGNWRNEVMQKSLTAGGYSAKAAPTGMNETIGDDGAFLVPPQFSQNLLQRTYENDLLSRTTLFPMTSNQLKIPTVNETSRANGSRTGGAAAYWQGEASSGTETKPGFAQVTLDLKKLMLFVRTTDELNADTMLALPTFLDKIAGEELQFKIGDGIINGTGVEQPLGVLNSPCRVAIARDAGASAAGNPVSTNLIEKMYAALWLGCRKNAVWLINQELEPFLNQMTIGVGTGGVVTYLPPGGLSTSPYATLMGKPVIVTEFNSAPGTEGDIILADLSAMLSGTKGGMQSAMSIHVYFESDESVYRFTQRLDNRPWWLKSLTPYKGSTQKSCFVTASTVS